MKKIPTLTPLSAVTAMKMAIMAKEAKDAIHAMHAAYRTLAHVDKPVKLTKLINDTLTRFSVAMCHSQHAKYMAEKHPKSLVMSPNLYSAYTQVRMINEFPKVYHSHVLYYVVTAAGLNYSGAMLLASREQLSVGCEPHNGILQLSSPISKEELLEILKM